MTTFSQIISAIDTHTAGEPTRIILSGFPPILGRTMAEKKHYMKNNLDQIRTLLMHEPRGHKDMFGAIITPPTTTQGQYGVIFIDNVGYLNMCGSGIIGIATALIEVGMIAKTEPETIVMFDTPAGLVESHAKVENNRVYEVSVANVSSFLYAKDIEVTLPDCRKITVDVSFGGNFFTIIQAKDLGVSIQPENIAKLIKLAVIVKKAVNEKLKVQHPIEQHINTIQLAAIFEQHEPSQPYSKNLVILGNGQLDRSPCGTGSSAIMATLYAKNKLQLGVEFTTESVIGTTFKGKLVKQVQVGDFMAVDPIITGEAFITGIQQFVVDPEDKLKYGFAMR